MTSLAEWFDENQIPVKLLDLDIENKARGSLTHFFGGRIPKININTPAGLDAFIDHLSDGIPVILADMGAGAGQITYEWFDRMYPDVAEYGIAFTAIGVVTADPASVESVLSWAARLQNRVTYLVVENSIAEYTDFTYWNESEQAQQFKKVFRSCRNPNGLPPAGSRKCRPKPRTDAGRYSFKKNKCSRTAESFSCDARSKLSPPDVCRIRKGKGAIAAMNKAKKMDDVVELDLTDLIADDLPPEL